MPGTSKPISAAKPEVATKPINNDYSFMGATAKERGYRLNIFDKLPVEDMYQVYPALKDLFSSGNREAFKAYVDKNGPPEDLYPNYNTMGQPFYDSQFWSRFRGPGTSKDPFDINSPDFLKFFKQRHGANLRLLAQPSPTRYNLANEGIALGEGSAVTTGKTVIPGHFYGLPNENYLSALTSFLASEEKRLDQAKPGDDITSRIVKYLGGRIPDGPLGLQQALKRLETNKIYEQGPFAQTAAKTIDEYQRQLQESEGGRVGRGKERGWGRFPTGEAKGNPESSPSPARPSPRTPERSPAATDKSVNWGNLAIYGGLGLGLGAGGYGLYRYLTRKKKPMTKYSSKLAKTLRIQMTRVSITGLPGSVQKLKDLPLPEGLDELLHSLTESSACPLFPEKEDDRDRSDESDHADSESEGMEKESKCSKHHGKPVVYLKDRSGEEYMVCPHCGKRMEAQQIYTDAKGWSFHRCCMHRGSIELREKPASHRFTLEYLLPPDEEVFDLEKVAAVQPATGKLSLGENEAAGKPMSLDFDSLRDQQRQEDNVQPSVYYSDSQIRRMFPIMSKLFPDKDPDSVAGALYGQAIVPADRRPFERHSTDRPNNLSFSPGEGKLSFDPNDKKFQDYLRARLPGAARNLAAGQLSSYDRKNRKPVWFLNELNKKIKPDNAAGYMFNPRRFFGVPDDKPLNSFSEDPQGVLERLRDEVGAKHYSYEEAYSPTDYEADQRIVKEYLERSIEKYQKTLHTRSDYDAYRNALYERDVSGDENHPGQGKEMGSQQYTYEGQPIKPGEAKGSTSGTNWKDIALYGGLGLGLGAGGYGLYRYLTRNSPKKRMAKRADTYAPMRRPTNFQASSDAARQSRLNTNLAAQRAREHPWDPSDISPSVALPIAGTLAGAVADGGTGLGAQRLVGGLRGLAAGSGAALGQHIAGGLTGGDMGSRILGGAGGGALTYLLARALTPDQDEEDDE